MRAVYAGMEKKSVGRQDERFSVIFNSVPVAIMLVRIGDGRIIDVNAAFTELWQYTRAEALDRTANELRLWVERAQLIERLKEDRHLDMQELEIRRKDGEIRDVAMTVKMTELYGSAHQVITVLDLTERNRARRFEHLAKHDALTTLPNRHQLAEALRTARIAEGGGVTALLFLDLDAFKAVNDTFGHRAGDELLRLVALRLKGRVRPQDFIARIGGDEFVILLDGLPNRAQAVAVARELIHHVSQPFHLEGIGDVHVGMSVGITYVPRGPIDADTLLAQADMAMYGAKRAGRSCVVEFAALPKLVPGISG